MTVDLHLGDCYPYLLALPDKAFDLCITDPPYGIGITHYTNGYGVAPHRGRKATHATWDNQPPPAEVFREIMRVSKQQIIFGGNYFMEHLHSTRCYIIWNKRGNMPKVPYAPVEMAWTSFDRQPVIYTVINHGFIRDSKEPRRHPTHKPWLLLDMILRDFAQPGQSVLDPFMGGGSTGVAAVKRGCDFTGIEIAPHYFADAQTDIVNAIEQAGESCPD